MKRYRREWRSVPLELYQDSYEVSNYGEVRSVPRIVQYPNNPKRKHRFKGKEITQTEDHNGYLYVNFYNRDERNSVKVHRLVALAFIPNPDNKSQVNHKKGNKKDNRAWMLEWCTGSENIKHSFDKLGRKPSKIPKGKDNHFSKPIKQYTLNGKFIKTFDSVTLAADEVGVAVSNVCAVARGKGKTAGGFKWKYKRKITKQQYERAKQIVSKYEAQFALSFVRGSFTLNDLTILSGSISVKKLTEKVFSEADCYMLERLINEKIQGLEYCNVEDCGYLGVSFYRSTIISDEQINTVLECLNSL